MLINWKERELFLILIVSNLSFFPRIWIQFFAYFFYSEGKSYVLHIVILSLLKLGFTYISFRESLLNGALVFVISMMVLWGKDVEGVREGGEKENEKMTNVLWKDR